MVPHTFMKRRTLLTSLSLAMVVAGCGTTSQQQGAGEPPEYADRAQVAMYDSSTRPQTSHVDVYDTTPPQRPYKVIALITCEGAPRHEAVMTTAILYRARTIGADAVMNADTAFTQKGGGVIWSRRGGFGGGSETRCVFRARAIVYEDK